MNAKAVVAAVDFSAVSRQIVVHAARIAGCVGGGLVVAHVVPQGRLKDWEETMGRSFDMRQGLDETTQRLREMTADIPGADGARIEVRIGKPFHALTAILKESGAGLLVVGAHDVSRRRLGSVCARCARSSPADVLILRDWQGSGFRRIAVCVDFSRSAAAAADQAVTLAACYGCGLEIIHVLYPPDRDPWGKAIDPAATAAADYAGLVRERARKRMDGFLAPFRDRLAGLDWRTLFIEGESPAAAIAAHVAAGKCDLTAIGSHEGSWLEDLVLGSNAVRILEDSVSSVLIARG